MSPVTTFVLLPRPRRVRMKPGFFPLHEGDTIVLQGDPAVLFGLGERLRNGIMATHGFEWNLRAGTYTAQVPGQAVITVGPNTGLPRQGYRLSVTKDLVHVVAGDAAGAFYGVNTLIQLLRQSKDTISSCEIEDWPDFPDRGVMLDISRDKVPTMETLFKLVDDLAAWKINHLELYMEHTFAYRNHPEVWSQASPMTGEEILRLDAYCRERFVELVPNQNSFGHMHRWLNYPRYRDLAECASGFDWPWGGRCEEPFSLCPTEPGTMNLLEEMYDDLLPYFSSRKFNVGCDETFDVGLGKSKSACDKKGHDRVYLDFLLKLYRQVKRRGRTMMFWGDIIIKHPDLVPELPKDSVVLEWGYEANHPFDANGAKFAKAGIPFYVCPGTSAWNSLSGRTDNALGNLRNAAKNGLKHGATGYLITDWGDHGHHQYLPTSYLGYAAGAALSWCYDSNRSEDFVDALNVHVFQDTNRVMGKLAFALGNTYLKAGFVPGNASVLCRILMAAPLSEIPKGVTGQTLRKSRDYVEKVLAPLTRARMRRPDAALVEAEFMNTGRMLRHGCDRGIAFLENKLTESDTRESLASDLRGILGAHQELWMARNRVGGLSDSLKYLQRVLDGYVSELPK